MCSAYINPFIYLYYITSQVYVYMNHPPPPFLNLTAPRGIKDMFTEKLIQNVRSSFFPYWESTTDSHNNIYESQKCYSD